MACTGWVQCFVNSKCCSKPFLASLWRCIVIWNTLEPWRGQKSQSWKRSLWLLTPTIVPSSNCAPTSVFYGHMCHISLFYKCFQGWWLHHFAGQPFQCLTTLSTKKCFLISNLNNNRPTTARNGMIKKSTQKNPKQITLYTQNPPC